MMADCRFCGTPAVARYAMDQGCVCYPYDREQDLCATHAYKATPLGEMVLLTHYVSEDIECRWCGTLHTTTTLAEGDGYLRCCAESESRGIRVTVG